MAGSNTFKRSSYFPDPSKKPAMQRFLDSMKIGYIEWHDGIGYDLDALNEMTPEELKQVEELVIPRKDSDWRDVETLAALNTTFTIQALKECLHSPILDCRLFSTRYLKEMNIEDRIEEIVVSTLPETKIGGGLTYALNLAKTYPTERIRRTVLRCTMTGNDDIRVHCAALALFLYGKADTDFDSNQEIVFEFHNQDVTTRRNSFIRLCDQVGVKPEDVLNNQ